jgi:hypothetical protein
MTEPGGRTGRPGVWTASGSDEDLNFLGCCFRIVEGGITSVDSAVLGKSLSPERHPSLKCDVGEDDSSQEDAKETRGGGAPRKICDFSTPSSAASKEELSDVTAAERSNSSPSGSSSCCRC